MSVEAYYTSIQQEIQTNGPVASTFPQLVK